MPVMHLIVRNGLKRPASRRQLNRTFTPSYPRATAYRKSRARSIPILTCDSVPRIIANYHTPNQIPATGRQDNAVGQSRDECLFKNCTLLVFQTYERAYRNDIVGSNHVPSAAPTALSWAIPRDPGRSLAESARRSGSRWWLNPRRNCREHQEIRRRKSIIRRFRLPVHRRESCSMLAPHQSSAAEQKSGPRTERLPDSSGRVKVSPATARKTFNGQR